jgi:4-amino-4-deoxy-L-arabinose transferase-like glycosyltransferase
MVLALRPGLWGDEIFSLAMATGHSLEHPAAEADPALGDFVEPQQAVFPSALWRYTAHENPAAGASRVIRAVLLSDTSPPLYYLLLNAWTRLFGAGDGALRLFSTWWAVLSLPFVWGLGRRLGGRRMAWSASLLFILSPVSLYYSTEGRMYSQLWFLASALAWQTLRLARRRPHPLSLLLWVALAAAGLLTHYFFLFVCVAFLAWLTLFPDRLPRSYVLALAGLTALAVLPWYVQVPASLARWRVSGNWLAEPLHWPQLATRPFELVWSLLAGGSFWGGSPGADACLAGLYLLLGLWIVRKRLLRRVLSRRHLLLWAWVVAAVLGPWVFDLVRHTSASLVPRYVLAGFPAALLLASLGMRQLRPQAHAAFLVLVMLAWIPGAWPLFALSARPWAPYREVDAQLEAWAEPTDLILVHSIPSGLLGIARYLTREVPLASWIVPLGRRRVPDDLERLLAGRHRVALVQVHNLSQPSPAEPWLRSHARLTRHEVYAGSRDAFTTDTTSLSPEKLAALRKHQLFEIFYFEPSDGTTFVPASIAGRRR